MKFSVILPVYNVEQYIKRCLLSILRQTYHEYELIVINDGSTDSSMHYVKEILKNTDVKYNIINQKNMGLGAARNNGVKQSNGEYLVFVDSDDYIEARLLEILSKAIDANHPDLICFNYIMEFESGKKVVQNLIDGETKLFSIQEHPEMLMMQPAAWNKSCSRKLFLESDCWYLENKLIYEDTAMSRALIASAKRIQFIPEPLYYYVQRKNSIMHSNVSKIMDIVVADRAMLEWMKKKSLYDYYTHELHAIIVRNMFFYAIDAISMETNDITNQKKLVDFVIYNCPDVLENRYFTFEEKKKAGYLLQYKFKKYRQKYILKKKIKLFIKSVISK